MQIAYFLTELLRFEFPLPLIFAGIFSMVNSYKTIPSKITAGFQNVYPRKNDAPGDVLSENSE